MFEIDRDVPVVGKRSYRYPFAKMEPNDSFMVNCADAKKRSVASNISAAARRYTKDRTARFTVHKVDGGVRCWRTE